MNKSDIPASVTLRAGRQLTVACDSGGSALVHRYRAGTLLDSTTLRSSQSFSFGPYGVDVALIISCLGGTLSYSESESEAAESNAAPLRTVTDADADVTATDAGAYVRMTATGAKTLTFQPEADCSLPTDFEVEVRNAGASGDVTLTEGDGVTLNPPAAGTLVLAPGMTARVKRVAADEFDVSGATVAV